MFRANSEMTVAISVASPEENLSDAASERPFWRAVTMSWSERIRTWMWSFTESSRLVVSQLDQPAADRVAHQARRLVDVELPHQPGSMRLGRLGADPEQPGDLFRGLPLADELEDLALSRSEQLSRD